LAITTLTIGGTAVSLPRDVTLDRMIAYCRGGMPSLAFSVPGGPLLGLPDPYLGKEIILSISGTVRFKGDVVSVAPAPDARLGWTRKYQALGMRNRGDWFAHEDANNGTCQSAYNLTADNQLDDYLPSRAGRTVGQILQDVFTMPGNAAKLSAYGFVVSATTLADLAALTLIPRASVYFGGERFLSAADSLLLAWAQNYALHVQPDGTIRILDLRTFTAHTLTMDAATPEIFPSAISRDISNCFTRVEILGAPIAEPFLFGLVAGGLSEALFAHDGLTVAAAKAAWKPADWTQPGLANGSGVNIGTYDTGTCTCPTTTTVTCTSSNSTHAFAANWWDQTASGRHGVMMLQYSTGTLITSYAARNVVANTSMSAGGTATFTLDRALPNLLFDRYTVTGTTKDASVVWCLYQLPAWAGPKVAKQTTYPFAFHASSGLAETTTSSPTGWILYSDSGSPPYQEYATPVTVDSASGTVRFAYPTYLTAGAHVPTDVRAVVPIYTGANQAFAPSSSSYSGTAYTVEGIQKTLTVPLPAWRDPAALSSMNAFAADILDAVSNTVLEGTVTYLGLYTLALDMGIALNIAGNGYVTGWEAGTIPALPVVECQVEWPSKDSLDHITTLRCSSRRAHLDSAAFLPPSRTGITWDFGEIDARLYGLGGVQYESTPIVKGLDAVPRGLDAVPRGLDAVPRGLDAVPRGLPGPTPWPEAGF
jgi:hypothetical protein